MIDFATIKWNADGLIPAVAQETDTGEVLMLAWVNAEALQKTIETGIMHYWSRSRGKLWRKGETSGHEQTVTALAIDCDNDTLLATVKQKGAACHTGERTCFFTPVEFTPRSDQ